MATTTLRTARHVFMVLAVLVAMMGAYHMMQGTLALAEPGVHAWLHMMIGVLYMLCAIGLLFRPRGFVLFFGLVTVITVLLAVANVWSATSGAARFNVELALGFIVFPIALNLLTADAIHEESVSVFDSGSRMVDG
jgi:hypothetical protein